MWVTVCVSRRRTDTHAYTRSNARTCSLTHVRMYAWDGGTARAGFAILVRVTRTDVNRRTYTYANTYGKMYSVHARPRAPDENTDLTPTAVT